MCARAAVSSPARGARAPCRPRPRSGSSSTCWARNPSCRPATLGGSERLQVGGPHLNPRDKPMRFDFSSVDDVESYINVPEGMHNCRVAEVREGRSRDGSVRWSYCLEVIDGEWAGRTAAWDSLTWSERGIYRVKKVLAPLGLDVKGVVEIESNDLVG